jgi:lipopolysaccharide transport system permease protein
MFGQIWAQRDLIISLTTRELASRYRGSALGSIWALLVPLLMLLVYTFVFSVVFNARWQTAAGGEATSSGSYSVHLFSGLVIYGLVSEVLNRAPGLLLENVAYIKKVAFPLEVMPVVTVLAATFNAIISFSILLIVYLVVIGTPPTTALLLPLYLLAAALIAAGMSWIFAALGVYLRDIRQVVGLATTALMFLSPVFYPLSQVPESFRNILQFNPLSLLLEGMRDALFSGTVVPLELAELLVFSIAVAVVGRLVFARLREGFADVV